MLGQKNSSPASIVQQKGPSKLGFWSGEQMAQLVRPPQPGGGLDVMWDSRGERCVEMHNEVDATPAASIRASCSLWS